MTASSHPHVYDTSLTLPTSVRRTTVAERAEAGKSARKRRPRTGLGEWTPPTDRPDPVALLASQETIRVQALLPLRHERMSASAFAFYRGGAAIMADDLGQLPNSGITTQLCGDAHLSNFGVFAAPDRSLIFDVNDFDETHPGPFEWDVFRLATSFVLAGREVGLGEAVFAEAAANAARAYRQQMATYAGMGDLGTWYDRIDLTTIESLMQQEGINRQKQLNKAATKARSRTAWSAIEKMTDVVDGERRFLDLPPLLMPVPTKSTVVEVVERLLDQYRDTLPHDRKQLMLKYHVIDMAHKVVGVGSVGLLAFVILMQGRDPEDLIVLQAKQAVRSVLEQFTAPAIYPMSGERVVAGQQLMQAASDIFLGWVRGPAGRDFYIRQLRDMKFSPDPATFDAGMLRGYAILCGRTLARAHARAGDAVAMSGYMGTSDKFDVGVRDFALAYADQVGRDYDAYKAAIAAGTVSLGNHAEESRYTLELDPSTGVDVVARPLSSTDAASGSEAPPPSS